MNLIALSHAHAIYSYGSLKISHREMNLITLLHTHAIYRHGSPTISDCEMAFLRFLPHISMTTNFLFLGSVNRNKT